MEDSKKNNGKSVSKYYLKVWALTLVAVIGFCFFATVAQGAIPDSWIRENSESSRSLISKNRPIRPYIDYHMMDLWTEREMIDMPLLYDNKISVDGGHLIGLDGGHQNRDQQAGLNRFQRLFNHGGYSRYWHGYTMFIKPLLIFGNILAIRKILLLVGFSLAALTLAMVAKRLSVAISVALGAALGVVHFNIVLMNLEYAPVFLVMFAVIIAMMFIRFRTLSFSWIIALFTISGGLTVFYDFLTTPTITLVIPLLLYILDWYKYQINEVLSASAFKTIFMRGAGLSLAWGGSYILTWVSKWIIVELLIGDGIFTNIFYRFSRWAGGNLVSEVDEYSPGPWEVLKLNWRLLTFANYISLMILITVMIAIISLLLRKQFANLKSLIILMLIFGLVAIVPVMELSGIPLHSQFHDYFTYRTFLSAFFPMFLIWLFTIYFMFKDTRVGIRLGKWIWA